MPATTLAAARGKAIEAKGCVEAGQDPRFVGQAAAGLTVAALVDGWGPDSLTLTLVNVSPSVARSVIVQGGAYAEHQIASVSDGKATMEVNAPNFPVRLAPGAGARLTIRMKRFANDPTLSFPWESTVADLGNQPDIAEYVHKSSGVP